ncbi:T9SS type A sorting domain-containing protein [Paracrocinitomix mangrovi]|uniref:T9SS type A sorting domain-containing protein n=1 Tax=Paracrocinitomix mangrovi TaxID=2862509 RepID=UPI001C8E38F4|nr:T9SS type A sorting domain-containing protein [Paracrocinitomix mangrovi]UKN01969.1 T9SS type A sorting domain-containing protein [Paracrocinitomix mangrovi]
MKKGIAALSIIAATSITYGQGWNGTTSGDVLYPINSSLGLSPMSVGIGLNNPTAQFHTNGSVRLEGLTINTEPYVVVADVNGNLSIMDASSFGTGNDWHLTGNTIGTTEFIGTINNQDFRVRTNNLQRMVVTAAGDVGIGTTSPGKILDVHYSENLNYLPTQWNRDGLQVYNSFTTTAVGQAATITLGARGGAGTWMARALISGVVVGTDQMDIAFQNEYAGPSTVRESMRITHDGFVGINVAAASIDSYLHTDGGIRHENLPTGNGRHLVIDANGYVYVEDLPIKSNESNEEVEALRNEIELLKAEVESLKNMISEVNGVVSNETTILSQNRPNPTVDATSIDYSIGGTFSEAFIVFYDLTGKLISSKRVNQSGTIQIDKNEFGRGTYQYALVVDGEIKATKKMIVL